MPVFERIDIKKRRPIPPLIQIILLVAIVFGIYLRSCWKKHQAASIQIQNVEIADYTPGNIDVTFTINNPHDVALKKALIIKIYDEDDYEVASKLVKVEIAPQSNKKYLKVLTKFNRSLLDRKLSHATVEIYPS